MIRLKNQSTRRAVTVSAIITILIVSVAVTAISSSMQNSYAQIGVGTRAANTCQKLPITSVTASGNDGHVPTNVLDNNLNTRWSNLGIGSWIQADLGSNMNICSVVIAWYNGNIRQNNFVISVSNDGTTFTNVFTGKSSGTTLSPETYILPGGTTGRYVRVTVNGNTQNNWASITDLSVDGSSSTPNTNCIKLPFSSITASGNDGNLPANVFDNNLNTRWSNLGVGSFIQADLGGQKNICSVDIAWYRGTLRDNSFVISVSNDGTSFTSVFSGTSSGTTLSAEKYGLPSATARFVRVTVNGNTENNWASIAELSVDGFSNTPPQNNPPTADSKTISTNAGTPVRITLTGTDTIPGDVLKFSVVANPLHGTLTNPTSNTVTYTPNAGFSGTDSFTYRATDGQGVSSNIATVTIKVNAAQNNPPTADSKTISTNAGTPVRITLTGTDPIPGDVLKFTVVGIPQHGTLTPDTTSNSVTYTPNAGFSGTDSFTYRATDGQRVDSNLATIAITVNAPPSPTADNKAINTKFNTPIGITLMGTDPIPGDLLKFSVVHLPQHGTLSTSTTANSVTYTPNTGFSGNDSFTYRATDGQGVNSTDAKVTITVNALPPPPPTADNKTIQTNKGTPIGITLTGTDPITGDLLKFSVAGNPQHGTVAPGTVSSNVFYTPNTGFIGTDSFTYKATDGQGVDSNIATVTVIVSNGSSGTLDPFGVREIYPTKAGGEHWFMNMSDPNHDSRTDPQTTLTKNPDGSWKVTSNAVRFNVFTSSGYNHDLITTLNQAQLAAKGYMQSPNDWKNIEITGYVKFNKGDTSDGFTWYARGGHHTGSGFPLGCEGTSIKEELDFAGTTRFEKEQWHVHYVFTPHKPATDPIQGKWVGYKAVMYNIEQNGTIAVKEEIWLDPNNIGNWIKVNEFTDAGGFGDQGQVCGGKTDQIITWGGPIATFRWDKTTDVDIKDFSIREIKPSQ
jgi:hypothetical protein